MTALNFNVKIITPEDVFFRGEVVSLTAPGEQGYLGILKDHAPLVTPLVSGQLTLKMSSQDQKVFDITAGFLEVNQNQVVILVEEIAKSEKKSV